MSILFITDFLIGTRVLGTQDSLVNICSALLASIACQPPESNISAQTLHKSVSLVFFNSIQCSTELA